MKWYYVKLTCLIRTMEYDSDVGHFFLLYMFFLLHNIAGKWHFLGIFVYRLSLCPLSYPQNEFHRICARLDLMPSLSACHAEVLPLQEIPKWPKLWHENNVECIIFRLMRHCTSPTTNRPFLYTEIASWQCMVITAITNYLKRIQLIPIYPT